MERVSQWGRGADVQWHMWICREVQNVEKPSRTSTPLPLLLSISVHTLYKRILQTQSLLFTLTSLFHEYINIFSVAKSRSAHICQVGFWPKHSRITTNRGGVAETFGRGCFILIVSVKWERPEDEKRKMWPLISTNPKTWSSKLIKIIPVKSTDCKCDGAGERGAVHLYSPRLR